MGKMKRYKVILVILLISGCGYLVQVELQPEDLKYVLTKSDFEFLKEFSQVPYKNGTEYSFSKTKSLRHGYYFFYTFKVSNKEGDISIFTNKGAYLNSKKKVKHLFNQNTGFSKNHIDPSLAESIGCDEAFFRQGPEKMEIELRKGCIWYTLYCNGKLLPTIDSLIPVLCIHLAEFNPDNLTGYTRRPL